MIFINRLHQNFSKVSDLPELGQGFIRNISLANPLQRTYQYLNNKLVSEDSKNVQIDNVIQGFGPEGMFYSNGVNSTYRFAKPVNCPKGVYVVDIRCLFWYKMSKDEQSFVTSKPEFNSNSQVPILTSGICQPLRRHNTTTQKDEIYMVTCMALYLNKLSIFFQNFVNQTKYSYIIEPRSQSILFNSQNTAGQLKKEIFYEKEFELIKDQEGAKILNNTINQNYGKWVYNTMEKTNLKEMIDTQIKLIIETPYQKNDTKYIVIMNPIILYDKLPQYKGVISQQPKGVRTEIMYLQVNFISDEDLRKQANDLIKQFDRYFLYLSIALISSGVLSILFIIYYTARLHQSLEIPIEHLTKVMVKMLKEIKSKEIFTIYDNFKLNFQDIFLSKETYLLYQSFESIFQMLIYSSENFYNENQTTTLLRLYRNIEFFNKFKNNYAVGIIHNNIGCLLLSQCHYFQALEHFSQSTLYAQYEIQEFLKGSKDISINAVINTFCFNDNSVMTTDQKEKHKGISNFSIPKKESNYNFVNNEKRKKTLVTPKQSFYQLDKQDETFGNKSNINVYTQRINALDEQPILNQTNYDLLLKNQEIIQHQESKNINVSSSTKQNFDNSQSSQQLQIDRIQDIINPLKGQKVLSNKSIPGSLLSSSQEEQLNNLILNLYYRKKNYVITLIAFQENHDKRLSLKQSSIHYNFWIEIKILLNQLLKMTRNIEIYEQERIELLTLVSKCQLNLNKIQKAYIVLNQCQTLGKVLQQNILDKKGSFTNRQSKTTPQNNFTPIILNEKDISLNRKVSKMLNQRRLSSNERVIFSRIKQNSISSQSGFQKSNQQIKTNQNQQVNINMKSEKQTFYSKICQLLKTKKHNSNLKSKSDSILAMKDQFNKSNNQLTENDKNRLEPLFDNLRKLAKYYQDMNENEGDQFFQIINLALIDYLVYTQQYYQAVTILTELFENNQTLYSHFPFQIQSKLYNIFQLTNIHSKELIKMRLKFNKNINMRVSFIIGNKEPSKHNCIQSLKLLSDLINQTLTKRKDQIGVIYYNQQDDLISSYMEMINVSQIKELISISIQDLFNVIMIDQNLNISNSFSKEDSTIQQQPNRSLVSNYNVSITPRVVYQQQQQVREISLNQLTPFNNQSKPQTDFLNVKQNKVNSSFMSRENQSHLNYSINEDINNAESKNQLIMRKSSIGTQEVSLNKIRKQLIKQNQVFDINYNVQRNQEYNNNNSTNNKFNNIISTIATQLEFNTNKINRQSSDQQKQFQQTKTNNLTLEMDNLESDFQTLNQNKQQRADTLTIANGKQQLSQRKLIYDPIKLSELICDQESILNESQYLKEQQQIKQDFIFHLSIRKSINQFITNTQYHRKMQQNPNIPINQELNLDLYLESQKKFIILTVDELLIKQNYLFTKLCECLFYFDITLIIMLFTRGNNFIEISHEGTYIYKEKEIIKIFYSIQNIQNYLNSQRNNFSSHIYPTYIQHF